jgi:proteasome accessory factor B
MNPKINSNNLENSERRKKKVSISVPRRNGAVKTEKQEMLRLTEGNAKTPHPTLSPARRGRAQKSAGGGERRGRNVVERVFAIRQLIMDKKYPNCETLAERFEYSTKTIKRDIQWIRDHWDHLRLTFDARRNGYFFDCPTENLPAVPTMTEADMFALFCAYETTERYRGTPMHQPLEMAFKRMTGQLDKNVRYSFDRLDDTLSFRPFAPEIVDAAKFEAATRAMQNRRALRFSYKRPKEKPRVRHVHPYHLTNRDNRWYLVAFDVEQGIYKSYVLGRIEGAMAPGEKFVRRKDFDPNKHFRGSFTTLRGDGDYAIVLHFDAWATEIMAGKQWHESQKITPLPGGGSRMQLRLSALEEIERWILSWGTHVAVMQPNELARRVGMVGKELMTRYADVIETKN